MELDGLFSCVENASNERVGETEKILNIKCIEFVNSTGLLGLEEGKM